MSLYQQKNVIYTKVGNDGVEQCYWKFNKLSLSNWWRVIRYKIAIVLLPEDYRKVIYKYNKFVFNSILQLQNGKDDEVIH